MIISHHHQYNSNRITCLFANDDPALATMRLWKESSRGGREGGSRFYRLCSFLHSSFHTTKSGQNWGHSIAMFLGPRVKNAFFWRQRKSVGFKRLSITVHTFLHHWTWIRNQFCCFFSTNLLSSSTKVPSKYPPHPPFRVQLPFIKHLVTTVRVICYSDSFFCWHNIVEHPKKIF